MTTALVKIGWHLFFKEDRLWGSYKSYKVNLLRKEFVLYEALSEGLSQIFRSPYHRRQTQQVRRAIVKVENRRRRHVG